MPANSVREAPSNVYRCIAEVSAELAKTGIAKDRKNAQQGYSFRGIDDVYNVLAPVISRHGLVILPRILSRECVERTSKSGSAQFFVTVEAEFDFVCAAEPDSRHVVRTFGEAQDSGDKATNKAMSAAYKYAAFQTFCIPTEGDNDADGSTPEPSEPQSTVASTPTPARPQPAHDTMPLTYEEQWLELAAAAEKGTGAYNVSWAAMPVDFKNYTLMHRQDKRAALKLRAAEVTKLGMGKP